MVAPHPLQLALRPSGSLSNVGRTSTLGSAAIGLDGSTILGTLSSQCFKHLPQEQRRLVQLQYFPDLEQQSQLGIIHPFHLIGSSRLGGNAICSWNTLIVSDSIDTNSLSAPS